MNIGRRGRDSAPFHFGLSYFHKKRRKTKEIENMSYVKEIAITAVAVIIGLIVYNKFVAGMFAPKA